VRRTLCSLRSISNGTRNCLAPLQGQPTLSRPIAKVPLSEIGKWASGIQPAPPGAARIIASMPALITAGSDAQAAITAFRSASTGSAIMFLHWLVPTLVQTCASVVANSFVLVLAFDTLLIVDLGIAGSSPVSHPSCGPLASVVSGPLLLTSLAVTASHVALSTRHQWAAPRALSYENLTDFLRSGREFACVQSSSPRQ